MSAASSPGKTPDYFVPSPSPYPVRASFALLITMVGASSWVNDAMPGKWGVLVGLAMLIWVLFGWFGTVIGESEGGMYSKKVDTGFRWSMSWFIFSEVMFFAAFFGALYYARVITVPWLADLDHKVLWPEFTEHWPTNGPAGTVEPFTKMPALGLPTINTLLLLASGVTLTYAHHALLAGNRASLKLGMVLTILLGATFLGCQAYEYMHAYADLNLKLTSGIYGSTFFMLTGFHGFHVTLGATMLIVIYFRILKGHFTADHHFAFEAVAWYWHFVDVVWIGLYIVVYWL